MKRANWVYLVATAVVLSTGVSVAGARARHHDNPSRSGTTVTVDRWSHGHDRDRWQRRHHRVTTTTTEATTTTTTTTNPPAPRVTTTTAAPTTTTTTFVPPIVPPPLPDPPTVGAFLSYPHQSGPTTINGGNNVVVSNKTWQGFSNKTALVISGAHNVYLHDLDFADNGGDIFLVNCTGQIRIEDIRARNTGDGTIGSGHGNVVQLNNTWDDGTGGIRGVNAYGGDTEDMISIFRSGGVDAAHPLVIENNHLESPLSGPLAWSSGSGTGINLADAGGHDIIARNNTLLNVGQVGLQINEGTRVHIVNNVVYGAARPGSNTGITQWASGSCGCSGNEIANNRIWWVKANGTPSPYWSSGTAGVIAGVATNVMQDLTINPASLHVAL
jgi:hypothetical protein